MCTRARENRKKDRKIEELCTKVFLLLCFGYCFINTFMLRVIFNVYYFGKSEFWNFGIVFAFFGFIYSWVNFKGKLLRIYAGQRI